jgi:hypothetical protein
MLNIKPVKLELIDGAKPYHTRSFPVPQSLEATTKKEMKRLTDIDVFNKSSDSEWAAPTFIQAKKTGDVRILTDFRRLNMTGINKRVLFSKKANKSYRHFSKPHQISCLNIFFNRK